MRFSEEPSFLYLFVAWCAQAFHLPRGASSVMCPGRPQRTGRPSTTVLCDFVCARDGVLLQSSALFISASHAVHWKILVSRHRSLTCIILHPQMRYS